jgi:hypothetical protein
MPSDDGTDTIMIMLHIVQCFFQVIFEGINTVENSVVK